MTRIVAVLFDVFFNFFVLLYCFLFHVLLYLLIRKYLILCLLVMLFEDWKFWEIFLMTTGWILLSFFLNVMMYIRNDENNLMKSHHMIFRHYFLSLFLNLMLLIVYWLSSLFSFALTRLILLKVSIWGKSLCECFQLWCIC